MADGEWRTGIPQRIGKLAYAPVTTDDLDEARAPDPNAARCWPRDCAVRDVTYPCDLFAQLNEGDGIAWRRGESPPRHHQRPWPRANASGVVGTMQTLLPTRRVAGAQARWGSRRGCGYLVHPLPLGL